MDKMAETVNAGGNDPFLDSTLVIHQLLID